MTRKPAPRRARTDAPVRTRPICTRVAVVGGGLAGLTLAAALGQAGLATVVIDREAPETRTAEGYDLRCSAIALASRRVLEAVGVWDAVRSRAAEISDIRIADGRAPVFLHYDHTQVGDEPFGHNVENRALRQALLARLEALPAVTQLAPASVSALDRTDGLARLRLEDGRTVEAELVVGADGRESTVRSLAGLGTRAWPYRQKAIVCALDHDRPHHGVAVEHFFPTGPFAVLPMPDPPEGVDRGGYRSGIIWTVPEGQAPTYLALDEAGFLDVLGDRLGDWLGRVDAGEVRLAGPRAAYPLGVVLARRYTGPRVALVADAAHAIHPIAGQALNLGIRDVAAIAEVVVERARLGLDVGEDLGRYAIWRRFDNARMVTATDLLNRLFSNDIAPLRLARDAGLAAVERLAPLKRVFMRQAMGLAAGPAPRTPRLLRGEPL